MLTFDHVFFQFEPDEPVILDGLSFHLEKGNFVSMLGVSGGGKSTILRLTNGLLKPLSGTISTEGGVGYMPQKDLLFPWRTIEKNLALPLEVRGVDKAERARRVDEALQETGLSEVRRRRPGTLSGGMRQRVSFARTLLTDSNLLLLDEPFSALDALTRGQMQEWLLKEWEKLDKTVLFITHDVEEAIFLSKQIYLIKETPIREVEIIDVPLPYPRSREDMGRDEIMKLKSYLVDQLRKQVVV